MPEEFDNFKQLNKFLRKERKKLNEGEKLTDYIHYKHVIQFFYSEYYRHFKSSFLTDKVNNSFVQKSFPKIIVDCQDYEIEIYDEFESFLTELSKKQLFDELKDYLPLDIDDLVRYAKDYSNTQDYLVNLSLLIAYFLAEDIHIEQRFYFIGTFFYSEGFFDYYATIPYVQKFLERYNGDEYNLFPREFPYDGEFLLPCSYVTFLDGFIDVKHPNSQVVERIPCKQSKTALDKVTPYLKRKLPFLWVEAQHGRILKIINSTLLNEVIGILDNKSSAPDMLLSAKRRKQYQRMSNDELRREIKKYKSQYLDYLSERQDDKFKLLYCIERKTHQTVNEAIEDSFIFTVKVDRLIVIVHENLDVNRSSIVFYIKPQMYETAIKKIHSFFASDIVNKRQLIASNNIHFKDSGIVAIERIMHNDFQSWKSRIDEL